MADNIKTVLITGCSAGGMGAALAVAFHEAGFHVYATARDVAKMATFARPGIDLLELDILSPDSIQACLGKITGLDVLVNNAGVAYSMPLSDADLQHGKHMFEVNVWAQIAITQACLPLLIQSKGMIVNQTSVVGSIAGPFQSLYNASKAAMSLISDSHRLEMEPFGVKVIDLKTGAVASNMVKNQQAQSPMVLPAGSIYQPAKGAVEAAMRHDAMAGVGTPADQWAKEVVGDLTRKNPPLVIWRGYNARMGRIASIVPHGMLDSTIKKIAGLDIVERSIRERG